MATEIIVPAEQEGTTAVVKTWLKQVGDLVRLDEPIVELETDKVAVEIAAPSDGVLCEILTNAGTEVEPGMVLGRIADQPASPMERPAEMAAAAAKTVGRASAPPDESQLPPGIRRLLAEHKLAANEIPLRGQKLSREDILAEAERRAKSANALSAAAGVTRLPHDSMRRRIAEHMVHSMQTAPHVTAVFEADFRAIAAHRNAHRSEFEDAGANLTFTAYFIAASATAMTAAPAVNGRWYDDRLEICDNINIGVGTALGEKGLIVPVIHRAQTLSLLEIARRLTELTEKARAGRLSPADVQNGTFSISNHGVSGSLLASPIIINQPQSAILGIGKLEKRAVVFEEDGADTIVIRPMAYVTLTIDHRVIDAYQTNAWLMRFVETLETWPVS